MGRHSGSVSKPLAMDIEKPWRFGVYLYREGSAELSEDSRS